MSVSGRNKPTYMKTYSKLKRRVEPWFIPDVNRNVFSLSSASSDQSIAELTSNKRKTNKKRTSSASSRPLRMAKQKAAKALKETDSDDDFLPGALPRRKPGTKLNKQTASTSTSPGIHASRKVENGRMRKNRPVFSSSEKENDVFGTKKERLNTLKQNTSPVFKHMKKEDSFCLPIADRFITQRKKVLRVQSEEQTFEQNLGSSHSSMVLHEVSFNEVEEIITCKRPFLCSTPSRCLGPFISRTSSLSCDEFGKSSSTNEFTDYDIMSKHWKHDMLQESKQYGKNTPETETVQLMEHEKYANDKSQHRQDKRKCSSVEHVPAQSPLNELRESNTLQVQIDLLKVECLSSCLAVCLHRLDLSAIRQAHQGASTETPQAQVAPALCLESREDQNTANLNSSDLVDRKSAEQSSGGEFQTGRVSASFLRSAISPTSIAASSKIPVAKDSSRKVCVSGLNSSRWSKKGMRPQNSSQKQCRTRTKPGHLSSDLLSTGVGSVLGEGACGWLQNNGVVGLAESPLRVETLNLSSFLTNFTPNSLTTQSWGRFKAALSVHKKKTAFPTPRRLALSNSKLPGVFDNSLDLFGSPVSNQASHHLPQSNISMVSCNEDISDAEKVYQECQQEGPLLFDDCIPPESMKRCIKIGEGTFGEVFSLVKDTEKAVALKIIPVEGHQKVNGEAQKSFGEILHEIIISKELSALNSKEYNKTNGFIGLLGLHCVRGCYPRALLDAWDKFDQEKGSENDRPDFFGKEQLFLILEFEFGGNDLENMNGKLSSFGQAKSVLHQVTAALAVAEEALCFEHRDLHWGNILVKSTKQKHNQFVLNGSVYSTETRGVHVNIIDYSLSRLEIDGLTLSCDIANEEELFMGQGDYQFEIYRLMKKENNNHWADYNPHSNVLWLHYLSDKLLNLRYKTKVQTSQQKALKRNLVAFHSEILNYHSAKDALLHANLFQ